MLGIDILTPKTFLSIASLEDGSRRSKPSTNVTPTLISRLECLLDVQVGNMTHRHSWIVVLHHSHGSCQQLECICGESGTPSNRVEVGHEGDEASAAAKGHW